MSLYPRPSQVLRRFYTGLAEERAALGRELGSAAADQLLQRLIVAWLLQSAGLLDNDPAYLLRRHHALGAERFAREFWPRCWTHGFAKAWGERTPDDQRVMGALPYLGERLCYVELAPTPIDPSHLSRLLPWFNQWRWTLYEAQDERAIDPAVLGVFVERGLEQRRWGAYYTAPDVSAYLARSTLLPALLQSAGLATWPPGMLNL